MKAVGYRGPAALGEDGYFVDLDLPVPVPGPRDLLVRVRAVSVNPVDLKIRARRPASPDAPVVLGFDAAGVVEAAGPEVELFRPGDEVMYAGSVLRPGSNAALQCVDERIAGTKPARLSFAEATSLPLTALTAHELFFDCLRLARDAGPDTVALVHGGGGGVARLAVQLLRALTGATVVATSGSAASGERLRALGAHCVIDYRGDWRAQLKDAGLPAPAVVGSAFTDAHAWAQIGRCIAPFGRIGYIDDVTTLDVAVLKQKGLTLVAEGMFNRSTFAAPDLVRQHEILTEVAALADAGRVQPIADTVLEGLSAATLAEAHRLQAEGAGKIVVNFGAPG